LAPPVYFHIHLELPVIGLFDQSMSKLSAILNEKCPKCRKGDLFLYPVFNLRKFAKMHTHCPVCELRFEIEPGFFIGAMYVSYGFILSIILVSGILINNLIPDPPVIAFVITTSLVTLVLIPPIFRYSRVLYLHWFGGVNYRNKQG